MFVIPVQTTVLTCINVSLRRFKWSSYAQANLVIQVGLRFVTITIRRNPTRFETCSEGAFIAKQSM